MSLRAKRSNLGDCGPDANCRLRTLCAPGVHRDRGLSETVASAAIKDVVAEIFHLEDCNVRPPGDRFGQMGLDDFADDDVMIALLDDAGDTAFDGSECRIEDRGSGRALV